MFIIITRTSFRPAFIFYVTRKLTLSLFLSNGDLFSKLCLYRDNDVLLQIDKDVRRLCPDLTFFQQVEEYWILKYWLWRKKKQFSFSQATPHPHRLLVGDLDEGVPPREKLHARVTQVDKCPCSGLIQLFVLRLACSLKPWKEREWDPAPWQIGWKKTDGNVEISYVLDLPQQKEGCGRLCPSQRGTRSSLGGS